MRRHRSRTAAALGALTSIAFATLGLGSASAAPGTGVTGPSTTTAPYVLPVADGVETTSILTVGDEPADSHGYEMVGIPDGLGASRAADRTSGCS